MTVEIDRYSGFCGGVIRAINKAETYLSQNPGKPLYCLGPIVHNNIEVERLRSMGLKTIGYEDLQEGAVPPGGTVLIRAHGEPPSTYCMTAQADAQVIDCTCPVVLQLQKNIREADQRLKEGNSGGQILIFGKIGHAEVLGLMGQTDKATVFESKQMLLDFVREGNVDLKRPIVIFSQTTKSPEEYRSICDYLREHASDLTVNQSICTQVASREAKLREFALGHDVIIFVSGKASSNGKILSDLCKSVNDRTFRIESPHDLDRSWFNHTDNVGVCGATSTPGWLLEDVASKILEIA